MKKFKRDGTGRGEAHLRFSSLGRRPRMYTLGRCESSVALTGRMLCSHRCSARGATAPPRRAFRKCISIFRCRILSSERTERTEDQGTPPPTTVAASQAPHTNLHFHAPCRCAADARRYGGSWQANQPSQLWPTSERTSSGFATTRSTC